MEKLFLWPNEIPNGNKAKRASSQIIDPINKVTKLTEVTNPSMDVFKPDASVDNGIGIIICPGGAYSILAIDLEGHEIAQWLTTLGYTAYVLQYRVPDNQKGALNDLQRAIKIIRSDSKFNHAQLGLIGFSAGGNLCAYASISPSKDSYSGIDEMDSISGRPDFTLLIYPAYLDSGKNNTLSPDLFFDKNTPPIFIFGTNDDPHFNSSLIIAQALQESDASFELHTFQEGGHGYGLRHGNKAAEMWPILAERWLNKIKTPTK
ncbi:alpha/beta hydrolase [Flavobacterium limnophilum]|uniref:alpha/beta hydrolase n=1 Tax=Flavobacterium limnophilum TaxID=3003262 RepID=UPI002482859E|nr:alpha/beta hydrolase [Flavobacterium limnophilum]